MEKLNKAQKCLILGPQNPQAPSLDPRLLGADSYNFI